MVKWRKERIGERSFRPILNTSHQLQMKIVEFHNIIMTFGYYQHTNMHLPAVCVSVVHSTFLVDIYMALFNFFYYVLHCA